MTTIDIFRIGRGTPITIEIDDKTVFFKKLQGEHKITSDFIHNSASALDVTIGDYITYSASGGAATGENYMINQLPGVVKINNSTFKYNISFEANLYNLNKKIFKDGTDGLTDFAYTGLPSDFIDKILSNINEINPTWSAATGTNSTGIDKTLQFTNESCLSALSKISEAYKMEYDINNKIISLQDSIAGTSGYSFEYGRENGLYKLTREQILNQNIITRCYGFGGTTNIPDTYRNGNKRLIFAASGMAASGYLDSPSAQSLYGIIEGVFTDDIIFPERTGIITNVNMDFDAGNLGAIARVDKITKNSASGDCLVTCNGYSETMEWDTNESITILTFFLNHRQDDFGSITLERISQTEIIFIAQTPGVDFEAATIPESMGSAVNLIANVIGDNSETDLNSNTSYIEDTSIDFDINDYIITGQTPSIVFKSGDLSGVQCEIASFNYALKRIYIRAFTDSDGYKQPNSTHIPAINDTYTLVNIALPQTYKDAAETKLQTATQKYLDENCVPHVIYTLEIDPKYAKLNNISLKAGDRVTIIDTTLSINKLIRISSIEYPLVNPYKIKIVLANPIIPYTLQERFIKAASIITKGALFSTNSSIKGMVPGANNAGANYFLNAKGAWAVPDITRKSNSGYSILPVFSGNPTFTGTVTIPSLIVEDLSDGYIPYQVAATDKLGNSCIYTDGTNVGIGTMNPQTKLHIAGDVSIGGEAQNQIIFRNQADNAQGISIGRSYGSNDYNDFYIYDNVAGANRFYIQNGTGNIGIGTANPVVKFQVNSATAGLPATSGTTQTNGAVRIRNDASSKVIDIGSYGNTGGWIQYVNSADLSDNYPLLLNPNGGNVGIGTINPRRSVDILSISQEQLRLTYTDNSIFTDFQTDANGDLTIKASGNDILIPHTDTICSADWVSRTTGWGIYHMSDNRSGGADFRYISVDEMHAKRFIADLEQALAGAQTICKSVAILHKDFIIPNKGDGPTEFEVEDLPGSTANVFVNNDWVQIRLFDRTGGGLTIANAWGTVAFVDHHAASGDEPGYQHWTFNRPSDDVGVANGETVLKGAIVLDYGVSGDGFIETTTLDAAGSPYQQIVTWIDHPWTQTVRTRLGQLDGIAGIGDEWGLFAGSITDKQYFLATDTHFELHGIDLMLYDGATNTVKLDHSGLSFAMGTALPTDYMVGDGIWMGKDTAYKMRVGTVSGGALVEGFSWNGTNFAIKGSVTATTGTIGGWTIGTTTITGGDATLNSTGVLTLGTGDDVAIMSAVDVTYRLWIGDATGADAEFSVTKAGALKATGITELGTNPITDGSYLQNMAIKGGHLWENSRNDDYGTLYINYYSYNQGDSNWRRTCISNGKGYSIVEFCGQSPFFGLIESNAEHIILHNLPTSASGLEDREIWMDGTTLKINVL